MRSSIDGISLLHLFGAVMLVAPLGPRADAQAPPERHRSVVINRVHLSDPEIAALEARAGAKVQNGNYWYDKASGAWGLEGGPTVGFAPPGLAIGGPLQADASNGNTGVFINGRELHVLDLVALQQITGPVQPGRYWVDAFGNAGLEGGPVLVNLVQLAAAARSRGTSGGTGWSEGGGWGYRSKYGDVSIVGGNDGSFFYSDGHQSYTSP